MTLEASLGSGVIRPRRDGRPITYRFLSPQDDLGVITELLHRAYARLAEAGLRFVASHQDVAVTRRRLSRGDTIVAIDEDAVVGIVTLARIDATSGSPFYDLPDVASFGQYAVDPVHQGQGIGSVLLEFVEALALLRGVTHLALDTSEHAVHLIRLYESRGYRFVEHVRWRDVNYRSVVMAKSLQSAGPASRVLNGAGG